MSHTTLLPGIFQQSQIKGSTYLIDLDIDRLIAPCYESAGSKPKKPRYGGWEQKEIAGHSLGHWLSAASYMYAATSDEKLLNKLIYAIDQLSEVQKLDSKGYVSGFPRHCFDEVFTGDFQVDNFSLGGSWVPWYSIHKIFAGLIDTYQMVGIDQALQIVKRLSEWAYNGLSKLTEERFQQMLICEHGGMNEVMADMYLLTEDEKYLTLAKRFCHQKILDPLAEKIDILEGKHANTQIPKVIGAAKLYEITREEKYQTIALFFWEQVNQYRTYANGGNSVREHFGPKNDEELDVTTLETCNTYNMLKLAEHLFRWKQDSSYMDYYENALYNHILASQDPDSGMKTYFMSTTPGHFKVYCSPEDSFWCCTGTGMENPARYTQAIYKMINQQLFVNLYIPSTIVLPEKDVELIQETEFPNSEYISFRFKQANEQHLNVKLRIPNWVSGKVKVKVNKEEVDIEQQSGYVTLDRVWNTGDVVELTLPMQLYAYYAKDDKNKQSFKYGPVLLAGAFGADSFPENDIVADHQEHNHFERIQVPILVTDEEDINQWLKPDNDQTLSFITAPIGQPGNQTVKLIPFYELHHQRYTIYWDVMNQAQHEQYDQTIQVSSKRLNDAIIDQIHPNEQQSEIDHQIKKDHSDSGYSEWIKKGWRNCGLDGYFSYQISVLRNEPTYLIVSLAKKDVMTETNNILNIRVNGVDLNLKEITLIDSEHEEIIQQAIKIPLHVTEGKEKVKVTFLAGNQRVSLPIYGLKTVSTLAN